MKTEFFCSWQEYFKHLRQSQLNFEEPLIRFSFHYILLLHKNRELKYNFFLWLKYKFAYLLRSQAESQISATALIVKKTQVLIQDL